jgi:hypothetical protein
MKPNLTIPLAVCALLLVGCASQQQKSINSEVANTPIICTRGDDCEVKWGRALTWVTQNSYYKIRNSTDSLITTESGIVDDGDTHASYSILKTAQGDGEYLIDFQAGYNNMFACTPSINKLRDSFFSAVEPELYHQILASHPQL